jgi:hypothetical protein
MAPVHAPVQDEKRPVGSSTAGVYRPVFDAKGRPITAGGFVEGAPAYFADITAASGLTRHKTRAGTLEKEYLLDTITGGVALFDYNNDGRLDIYVVNGVTYESLTGKEPPPRAALFRNNGDGTFTDVAAQAGVSNERFGFGVAVADVDNDGWLDFYVCNFGANRLYRNNGDGTFTDIAEKAAVAVSRAQAPLWSATAAFADYDRDGRVDLFVAGYVKDPPRPGTPGEKLVCPVSFCGPMGLQGERDFLFHNNGDGTFTEVSARAGVSDPNGYYGLAAAWLDVNDDGWVDLAVANDSVPNYLYLNRGDGTFEDASLLSGFALNEDGRPQASMGIAAGDYNHDGLVDLYLTHFSDDYNTLYRNEGGGTFADISRQAGLAASSIPFLGWGTAFLDYDNDGHADLFVANGHVYSGVDKLGWGTTWTQRPLLYRNVEGKKFELSPAATGSALAALYSARGAAFGDIDGDGKVDVVLNNLDAEPAILRNVTASSHNWLVLDLAGGPQSGRHAIGAVVLLRAGGQLQRGDVVGGGSFGSHSGFRLHFGLGRAVEVDSLEVRWPSGRRESFAIPSLNRAHQLEEGRGAPVDESAKQESKP